ncbi:hypothetical protein QBC33DRAFT_550789 [Phialemonium atrogriseum]|uniref:Chitin-binding type-1 domain-containing protein n=1 Tax=Phialemonium atrogriseum TaxID=1093897 RepID=A0AAJ0BTW4_9PEZI|nr:uncharacterized protein QBC33DRAFT_550789 [Phialemonium atrogriseum]KAK1763039.1 hypothetical protein QBC33DRAFT_550789 [Phialemonium atrogriseum]
MSAPSLALVISLLASSALGLPSVQCDATTSCAVGCCSEFGYCGFGPEFCGDQCQNNCDATADCGQYAPSGHSECPDGACCSQFGFCGTGPDFCGN